MNYLFTIAGKGSRFVSKGIKVPKPLVKVFGNELLIWSMSSFEYKKNDYLYIVSLKEHKVKEKLERKLENLYKDIKIFWLELDNVLNGQLLTSIKAINYFNIQGPIIIHNCDTFHDFKSTNFSSLLDQDIFGMIPCFKGLGDHWSFAKESADDRTIAKEVTEKIRISDNCSVGTYYFSSAKKLISLSELYFDNEINKKNEFYIAPIYQYAIEKEMKVKISIAKSVKIFGTITELLNSFSISYEELLGENSLDGHHVKTLVVDIDDTLCFKNEKENYSEAIPIEKVCNALRRANSNGVYIILFTSRNMRTFRGSMGLINKYTAPLIIQWLGLNNIPYDEIYFGKPWGNNVSYVDDKNLSIDDLLKNYS